MAIKLAAKQEIKVKGRAAEALLGRSAKKETPQIGVIFTITEGEHQGERVSWMGYFTDNTQERTIEALQICGWDGDDLSDFAPPTPDTMPGLHGLDRHEVELVLIGEEYGGTNPDYAGTVFTRVRWVNRLGGGRLSVENAMDRASASDFAAKMKGIVHAVKAKKPQASTDFPHGASAPAQGQLPATGTQGRRAF